MKLELRCHDIEYPEMANMSCDIRTRAKVARGVRLQKPRPRRIEATHDGMFITGFYYSLERLNE